MLPVIILAGGLATRMKPMTESIPKAMLPIAGRPFIEWQLELLKQGGIERVILCIAHLGEMIEQRLRDNNYGVEIQYSYDGDMLLGTGGAVKKAVPLAGDEFFVLYGDSYLDIDYQHTESVWRHSGKCALMTVYKNENRWDDSNVMFHNGMVVCYNKKKRTVEMKHIDYGLGILNAVSLEQFNGRFDLADVYSELANKNDLAGYEAENRFYEIGSQAGFEELNNKLNEDQL